MEIEDVMQSMGHKDRHVSLDTPLSEDEDTSLLDTLENHNAEKTEKNLCHTESLQTEIARSLRILSDRQKETICYFFGIGIEYPMSLEDIAHKLDVTPERVRQIKDKAISRLRTLSNFNSLRSFLGN